MDDIYSQLKALRLQEDQEKQKLLRDKLMSLAIRQGNVPEGQREYLQAKDLAEDGMGVRNEIMESELLSNAFNSGRMPQKHQDVYQKVREDKMNDPNNTSYEPFKSYNATDAATHNFRNRRDMELLEDEVAVQKAINQQNDLIKALKNIKVVK